MTLAVPLPSRPTHDPATSKYRTIDDFYETAYSSSPVKSLPLGFWTIFLALGIANSGDATEIGCMNYILSNPGFQEEILKGDYEHKGALIASSIFGGMLIGGILTGAFGDSRVGRRPTLLMGLAMNSLSGFASALAQSAWEMCIFRFFSGLGIGAVLSSLITLATELSPPSKRGFWITFVAGFWTIGSIYVAVMALLLFDFHDKSWRVFALVSAAPCFVGCILVWAVVPESARFLALRGRYEEALKTANKVADGMGYRGSPLTIEEVRSQFCDGSGASAWSHCGRLELESADLPSGGGTLSNPKKLTRMESVALHGKEAAGSIRQLYSKDLRMRTIGLQLIWFSMSFGSGLCTWITKIFDTIHVSDVYLYSLYFALANVPGNVAAGYLVDHVGRKNLLLVAMVSSALSLLAFSEATEDAENRKIQVVVSACVFHAFLVIGWCAITCMTSEIFPTAVRSTGMGICAAVGRLAAMLVQFVNGALVDQPSLLLMFAAISILAGAAVPIIFRMKDMSLMHLHDTACGDTAATTDVARGFGEGGEALVQLMPLSTASLGNDDGATLRKSVGATGNGHSSAIEMPSVSSILSDENSMTVEQKGGSTKAKTMMV